MNEYIRWTMSLRQRDEVLIKHFSENVVGGDRSAECRRLMYLGLEYERLKAEGNLQETIERNTTTTEKAVPIKKTSKETDKEKLIKRLNDLV
ncbi:hypothetical protein [Brevibacillus laterosporus]|uniref:hypothetical protein n=1 Tax=Brevibacillus laterosporus TaxID=1465 RepID=UPI003D1FFE46